MTSSIRQGTILFFLLHAAGIGTQAIRGVCMFLLGARDSKLTLAITKLPVLLMVRVIVIKSPLVKQ